MDGSDDCVDTLLRFSEARYRCFPLVDLCSLAPFLFATRELLVFLPRVFALGSPWVPL